MRGEQSGIGVVERRSRAVPAEPADAKEVRAKSLKTN